MPDLTKQIEAFAEEFRLHREAVQPDLTHREYLNRCVLFHTLTFDQRRISRYRTSTGTLDCDFEMNAFAALFHAVAKQVDAKSGRSGAQQRPLVLYCMDYKGSRYVPFGQATSDNLHIHALWACESSETQAYFNALTSLKLRMSLTPYMVDACQVQPFDAKHTLSESVSYTMKAWTKTTFNPSPWINFGLLRGHERQFAMPRYHRTRSRFSIQRKKASESLLEPWELHGCPA